MDYARAVATAPPGWWHFAFDDLERLPAAVRKHSLADIPPEELRLVEHRDPDAMDRARRALFWTLVYHLEPGRWDQLAEVEPVTAGVLDALPRAIKTSLDVGAGSGRLTRHLAARTETVIAIEPSTGLARILRDRLPHVVTLSAWAEALPIRDGWSQLTAACGAFGPDPRVLSELRRVTAPGGVIALVSPEDPDWFESAGWQRLTFAAGRPLDHEAWIDDFFGPLDPPHELVMTRV